MPITFILAEKGRVYKRLKKGIFKEIFEKRTGGAIRFASIPTKPDIPMSPSVSSSWLEREYSAKG